MREILFRGKAIHNDEFVYGDLIHGQGNKQGLLYILPHAHFYPNGCSELDGWRIHPESLGQFTGLTDKNGAKIWEGSIVKTRFNDLVLIKWDTAAEMKGKDMFEYTGFVAHQISTKTNYHLDRSICLGEVIGNVHENPELITCKTEKP